MPQINIKNLTSGRLSLDLTLDDGNIIVRESIPKGGTVDVGEKCTLDDLNRDVQTQELIAKGIISIDFIGDANDISMDVVGSVISGPTSTTPGSDYGTLSITSSDKKKTLMSVALFEPSVADITKPGIIAANAIIDSASVGTILDGSGLPAAVVETDENGNLELVIYDVADETIFVATSQTHGGPSINGSIHQLTFLA